jgi:vesicle coat complex subunit
MALSQIGEYIEDIVKISPMVPTVINHFKHENPKIRYAAIHCIGQLAEDMAPDFEENFHEEVLPALLERLSDPVPRVVSHSCAALTNFLENTDEEVAVNFIEVLLPKLFQVVD